VEGCVSCGRERPGKRLLTNPASCNVGTGWSAGRGDRCQFQA
jgi:hypothetical protein